MKMTNPIKDNIGEMRRNICFELKRRDDDDDDANDDDFAFLCFCVFHTRRFSLERNAGVL